MEVGQEEAVTGSKEQNQIAKGKRTKRQRLQSPILQCLDERDFYGQNCSINGENFHSQACNFSSNPNYRDDHHKEEDEDMAANCLILLAQGQSLNPSKQAVSENSSSFKSNNRRFMEVEDNGTGKVGYYVYECKTCSRAFTSFQALGGHRASHRKLLKESAMAVNEKKLVSKFSPDHIEEAEEEEFFKNNNSSNPFEVGNSGNKFGNKVHGCSVCGAEFLSGQALGGHMRRHRRGLAAKTEASSLASMEEVEAFESKKQTSFSSLDLDLNLPAPDDDLREQPAIVFATPPLVGCQY